MWPHRGHKEGWDCDPPAPAPLLLGPALGRNKAPRFKYFYIKNICYLLLQTSSVVTETRHTHHIKLLEVGGLFPVPQAPY